MTSDGVVVAESRPNAAANSQYTYLRRYPRGELYGHITGFFSYNFGATGIERSYNSMLAGHKVAPTFNGIKDLLTDKTVTADVTLTIDHQIQRAAAQALRERRGSIVVLDPRSGAILASVSYPPYDPNPLASTDFKAAQKAFTRYNTDPAKPMLARAYRELYPPGSTFKVVTAATGLDTEVVGTSTPVYPSLSSLPLPRSTRPLRNFGGSTCGGNLVTVFVISCNTSFAQLALDLGPERLHDGAAAFGFDRKVPLDVSPGAVESFFPPVSFFHLNEPQLAQAGIGQGNVRATPLQMALVAAAIANGGEIKEPHFVKEVRSSEGELVQGETDATFVQAIPADVREGAQLDDAVRRHERNGQARGDQRSERRREDRHRPDWPGHRTCLDDRVRSRCGSTRGDCGDHREPAGGLHHDGRQDRRTGAAHGPRGGPASDTLSSHPHVPSPCN